MIIVELDTKQFKNLEKYLGKISKKLGDLRIPLKQAGLLMIKSIDTNFKVQGRPNKWKPLSQSTVKLRRRGSSAILQDTGRLKGSFALEVSNWEARIGTSIAYAPAHNFGSVTVRNTAWGKPTKSYVHTIPQRKFMLFQEEDKKRIDKIFSAYIGKLLTDKMVDIGG